MKGWALRLASKRLKVFVVLFSLDKITAVSRIIILTAWVPCDKTGNRPAAQREKRRAKKTACQAPSFSRVTPLTERLKEVKQWGEWK